MTSELERLCNARPKVKCEATMGDKPAPWAEPGKHVPQYHWRVTLKYRGRSLTTDFWSCDEPNAAAVLSCLISDSTAAGSRFEDWASDLGYDVDSRKAYATWEACCKSFPKVVRFLGSGFDTFASAEH